MSQVSCEQEKTLALLQRFHTASFLTPPNRPPPLLPARRLESILISEKPPKKQEAAGLCYYEHLQPNKTATCL